MKSCKWHETDYLAEDTHSVTTLQQVVEPCDATYTSQQGVYHVAWGGGESVQQMHMGSPGAGHRFHSCLGTC